jgi:hypothetical protein
MVVMTFQSPLNNYGVILVANPFHFLLTDYNQFGHHLDGHDSFQLLVVQTWQLNKHVLI